MGTPFPFFMIELGGNEFIIGLTTGITSVAAMCMRPIAGWFLDNVSRKILFFAGIVSSISALILMTLIPILGFVIGIRIVMGFVNSGTGTASGTNAADAIPPSRFGEGIGYLGLGNTLASALGPAIGLAIMSSLGFTSLFIVGIAILSMALIAGKNFTFKEIDITKRKKIKPAQLFSKDAMPASVVLLLASVPFGGVMVFIALYGEYYEIGSGALFFILLAAGSGTSRLLSGRLIDRLGERPMVIFGSICFAVALSLLVQGSSVGYYFSGLAFGLGFGVMNPAMQAMAMRTIPIEKRGSATSTFSISHDISSGLGGLLAGVLVTHFGYRPMFGAMISFVAASFFAYMLWAGKTKSAFRVFNKAE